MAEHFRITRILTLVVKLRSLIAERKWHAALGIAHELEQVMKGAL